jgi:hypothetical protein
MLPGETILIGSTTTVPRVQGEASPESATKCSRLLHRNSVQLRPIFPRIPLFWNSSGG